MLNKLSSDSSLQPPPLRSHQKSHWIQQKLDPSQEKRSERHDETSAHKDAHSCLKSLSVPGIDYNIIFKIIKKIFKLYILYIFRMCTWGRPGALQALAVTAGAALHPVLWLARRGSLPLVLGIDHSCHGALINRIFTLKKGRKKISHSTKVMQCYLQTTLKATIIFRSCFHFICPDITLFLKRH